MELPDNPYDIAVKFCIERFWLFLKASNQADKITHFVVEGRGKKEDKDLELAFRRICNGDNSHNHALPIKLIFAKKESHSAGLQLADLFAKPIGRHYLDPLQVNRAYTLIEPKFYCGVDGEIEGYGLKHYPQKSENPAGTPAGYNADQELPIHLIQV